jgi:hypothetical protein
MSLIQLKSLFPKIYRVLLLLLAINQNCSVGFSSREYDGR